MLKHWHRFFILSMKVQPVSSDPVNQRRVWVELQGAIELALGLRPVPISHVHGGETDMRFGARGIKLERLVECSFSRGSNIVQRNAGVFGCQHVREEKTE